jgi:hypothetical protein
VVLGIETRLTLLAAGLIFLLALALAGVHTGMLAVTLAGFVVAQLI